MTCFSFVSLCDHCIVLVKLVADVFCDVWMSHVCDIGIVYLLQFFGSHEEVGVLELGGPVILWHVLFRGWGWSGRLRWVVCCAACLSLVVPVLLLWRWCWWGWRCWGKSFAVGCGFDVFCICCILSLGCPAFGSVCRNVSPFTVVGCCQWFYGWLSSRWAMWLRIPGVWHIIVRLLCFS